MIQEASNLIDSIGSLANTIRDFQSGMSVSLPAYLKSTNIMDRTYIEQSLSEEDIILPLMGMVNQMVVGFVMTALQLNTHVSNSKTVRRLLETVASENHDTTEELMEKASCKNVKMYMEDTAKNLSLEAKEQKLFSGRVIDIELDLGGDKKTNVLMYVQLIPYLIDELITKQIITLNVGRDLGIRYKKMRAGEISFLWDFLLHRDLINDRQKALKKDKTGVLYDLLHKQTNSLSKALLRFVGITPKNNNLANSILIVSENTYKDVCTQTNTNFDNKSQRDKFFKESFMMMLVVVDTMFNKVKIYFNGLDSKGEYSFKMIQANAGAGSSGMDKYDLKDIMTAMSHGMSPKI